MRNDPRRHDRPSPARSKEIEKQEALVRMLDRIGKKMDKKAAKEPIYDMETDAMTILDTHD